MAGLYLHIPFCKSRCIYCGFYSTTDHDLRQRYVDALCREMEMRPSASPVDTIYLGGGTPSQLDISQLRQLFIYINKVYGFDAKEITIEINPDDVTSQYAEILPQLGINRVSLGVQTFNDDRLRFLHRRHHAAQVSQAISILRDAGIPNISIDLMYGFPQETLSDWLHDINTALSLKVEHISAYCLMIEEGTPLSKMGIEATDDETERKMYDMLIDRLTAAGYEHYEISNFARPGYHSRHNSSYWQDIPYIGLGAAAHSYDGHRRSWNVSHIKQYIKSINSGKIPCEYEELDADTHYNDRVTTALRTSIGLNLTTLSDHHQQYCLKEAQCFIKDGSLRLDNNHLILTRKGLFISDYIMSSLMKV